jgi:hypothetical protein
VQVTIHHNVTKAEDGHLAIFSRLRGEPAFQAGDTLLSVFTFEVPEECTTQQALDLAWHISNAPEEACFGPVRDLMLNYRAGRVRSMCVGDVLEIDGECWHVAPVGFVAWDQEVTA